MACCPGSHFGPKRVPVVQESFKNSSWRNFLLFIPLCISPTHPPFCQLVLFLLCLNVFYLLCLFHFSSVSYSAFPFAFLYKLPLIDHCLECNCVFSFHVFLSIYYFPSSISQSSFYPLGGLRIIPGIFRVKKTKALTEKKKKIVQGHSELVQMRRTEDTAPTKTMSLTGPRPYHRYKNQLSSSNPTSQILE